MKEEYIKYEFKSQKKKKKKLKDSTGNFNIVKKFDYLQTNIKQDCNKKYFSETVYVNISY